MSTPDDISIVESFVVEGGGPCSLDGLPPADALLRVHHANRDNEPRRMKDEG
jgi:hypothetical protein